VHEIWSGDYNNHDYAPKLHTSEYIREQERVQTWKEFIEAVEPRQDPRTSATKSTTQEREPNKGDNEEAVESVRIVKKKLMIPY